MRVLISTILLSLGTQLGALGSPAVNFLTYESAQHRAEMLDQIHYRLHMDLRSNSQGYEGELVVRFHLKHTHDLFLDFSDRRGAHIHKLSINGSESSYLWEDGKIYLPAERLRLNLENNVSIQFCNSFSNTGKGLHRFEDREDKGVYIYTNLEPYYANEVFPVFDQPDLKASYELSVSAPASWKVIANTRESEIKSLDFRTNLWQFPATQKISSYLFALIAGPFTVWESRTWSGIPLRIFARQTLAQYIDAKDWLAMTRWSFAFLEKSFDYPYPFEKYDQILVPEFSAGAMENVGAVTFSEDRFVHRGLATPLQRFKILEVLAHEMAHMWFGDLVTMKWWDDLWLNESFATFMSSLTAEAIHKDLGLLDPWLSFNAEAKFYAYLEDGYQSTTHPIVGSVRNTDEALSNFDSITYRKGASVLKQLYFYVGKQAFYTGVRNYFKKHAYGNTTRHDFLESLSEASGLDLKSWDAEWLRSKGTNRIRVEMTKRGSQIESLQIKQNPDPMDKLLRTHRTDVGFYKYNEQGSLNLFKTIPVTYQGAVTEIEAPAGLEFPALVFPNVSDYDLVHVSLDPNSLSTVYKSLSRISSTLLRQQLYTTLWYMMRNSEISAKQFVNLVLKHAEDENDITVLDKVLLSLRIARTYLPKASRGTANASIANFLWLRLFRAKAGSALQTLLFDHFLHFATLEHASQLHAWLAAEKALTGMVLDQDRRWCILVALAALGYPQALDLIRAENLRDQSNRGLVQSMLAEASLPYLSVKKKWFEELSRPGHMVAADAAIVMNGFQNVLTENLTDFVAEEYFSSILKQLEAKEFDRKVAAFATAMYPIDFSAAFEYQVTAFLARHPGIPSLVRKAMLKRVEDSEKIRAARVNFGGTQPL